jgi:hypothetical protein
MSTSLAPEVDSRLKVKRAGFSKYVEMMIFDKYKEAQQTFDQIASMVKEANCYYEKPSNVSKRGTYYWSSVIDLVLPPESYKNPYLCANDSGLALVEITKKVVYPSSSKWYPRVTQGVVLVGRNESGFAFAHPVNNSKKNIRSALSWIWNGKEGRIIARQGDIALVRGINNRKWMDRMPAGHRISACSKFIEHASHPAIPVPGPGTTIIVAQRGKLNAFVETRD